MFLWTGCVGQSCAVEAGDDGATCPDVRGTHSVCVHRLLALQPRIRTRRSYLGRCAELLAPVISQSSLKHYHAHRQATAELFPDDCLGAFSTFVCSPGFPFSNAQ